MKLGGTAAAAVLSALMLASCVQHDTGIGIGAADDGKTFQASSGSLVRLSLPASITWNLESTDTQELQLVDTSVVQLGGDATRVWNFKLMKPGVVTLRAVPTCSASASGCPDHAVRFTFDTR